MAPSPIDFTCHAPCSRLSTSIARRNSRATSAAAWSPDFSVSDV